MADHLGPWVRLEGISISQLPAEGKGVAPNNRDESEKVHAGSASTTTAPRLQTFIQKTIEESVPFIDGVAPKNDGANVTWKLKGSPRTYDSSEAPVQVYERVVRGKDLDKLEGMSQFSADRRDETWFCRRSSHRNAPEPKTASWKEFVRCFKEHHAESEHAFTPTVIGDRQAMSWDTSGIEVEVRGERWAGITVVVEEMKHRIDPKPLSNRVFTVVQIIAALSGTSEFLVISIPITDFGKSPYADFAKDKSLVAGAYASVERIRILPSNGEIEWIMATASDAGGLIPQWVQNLAVPAAVAKDVDFFMSWIPSQRTNKDARPAPIPNSTE
ncbi:uncharacterized protein RSE6_10521 [Rhynchosporium secalis]|uniref:DUF3074 domain-containing protein n=1 Tax=Rhynchosporium secalis TaxID=38038 RepID=A0A1E1MKL6_RHYSE|nr:uncharacterized protein RSE6_10521 [Rhynchosporium secalis]